MKTPETEATKDGQPSGLAVAPSSARLAFEAWITSPPMEKDITRNSTDEAKSAWPGQYRRYEVQLAWESWIEGAGELQLLCADYDFQRDSVFRLRAEIERWRDSNNRLRAEMEHQARMNQELREALGCIADLAGTTEGELGVMCNAAWCAEQARSALWPNVEISHDQNAAPKQ